MRSTPHPGIQLTRSISSSAAPRNDAGTILRQVFSEISSVAAVFVFFDQIAVRLVHRDEPLRRRTKDHGVLTAPAMRVTMLVLFTEKQHASFAHKLDNRIVRIEHALAGEIFDLGRESPSVIDRTIDLQTVTLADHEVVVTMTGRSVHCSSARLAVGFLLRFTDVELSFRICFTAERDVIADHQQRCAIQPRMPGLEPVQLCARKACEHFRLCKLTLRRNRLDQITRNDVDLIAVLECRVFKVRMYCDSEIGRQRPRGRGPYQHKNLSACERRIDLRRITFERKLHIDRWTRVLVIFNLGFRQRGLILDAPVNRSRSLVDPATLDEAREHPSGFGFVVVRHCEIRIVPLAENTESLEITSLAFQSVLSVLATGAAKTLETKIALLLAFLFERAFEMLLDRQTVAVVARNVGRVEAHHGARFDDEIFEDLIHRGAEMDVGVRVWWTIVKDKFLAARASLAHEAVEVKLRPLLQTSGFSLVEISLLRKAGFRQIDGLF